MGPVPWTVNAEIYPQSCRGMGMATSTSVNWVSNYVVSLTFLSLLEALGGAGGFMFYAGFGVLGFIAIYLLLPETKGERLCQINTIEVLIILKTNKLEQIIKGIPLEQMDTLLSRGWLQTKTRSTEENDGYTLANASN